MRQARAQKSERKDINTSAPAELDENAEDKWREREPNLTGLTSEYDLALFRASQAEASTKYVSCIKLTSFMFLTNFLNVETGRRIKEFATSGWT